MRRTLRDMFVAAGVVALSASVVQASGTIRVTYDAEIDRLGIANFSDCVLTGVRITADVDLLPKSKFRQQRGDGGPAVFEQAWMWNEAYEAYAARLSSLPYKETDRGIAPAGFKFETFDFTAIELLGARTAQHATVETRFGTSAAPAAWVAAVPNEAWPAEGFAEQTLTGTWQFDATAAQLTVESCPNV